MKVKKSKAITQEKINAAPKILISRVLILESIALIIASVSWVKPVLKKKKRKYCEWDFPRGPMAKTLCSQCRRPRVQSLVRKLDPACHKKDPACCN